MDKTWAMVATGVVVAFLGGTAGYLVLNSSGDNAFAQCPSGQAGASIGGPFTLVDGASGKTVTEVEVIDRPTLVYFGYTMCPDVCPMDMMRNAEVVDLMEEQGKDLKLAFITVDPDRDTAQVVADFAMNHHPKAIGLTGTEQQIKTAVNAYRAYYKLGDQTDEYYTVDHSSFTYLMLPGTGLADFYRNGAPAEEVAKGVSCFLEAQGS
ncbi:SCO family protein [Xinfangfangia sp. CPCC 101601]|uniref:SCO family protein n=1 Tax=Pseudogemmobacter lacusdianii TaxID=3069608 RepID=A0ABU0VUI1_9RHOB|nr:SCO family protein [Xinfangfangia sp. CPCC 101601]MDQ2065203.1 SCO family protein [Xinfangfangia sp. CPCC 101601]